MKLSRSGELVLLDNIRKKLGKRKKSVLTGIGDDAAVLKADRRKLVTTTDMMLEGVHFDLRLTTPRQLGFKLVSVNVSDVYAMGAEPAFVLLGIAVPGDTDGKFIDEFLIGVEDACSKYKVSVVGGDVSASRKHMALSATLMGYANTTIQRSGAKVGQGIYVTGTLGDSSCGLGLLKKIGRPVNLARPLNKPLKWSTMKPLIQRHLMPLARKPGVWSKKATAMIDISDGLLIDLRRLCAESKRGARIYADSIPISRELKAAAESMRRDPLEFALSGGEDYELLFTSNAKGTIRGATRIGEITRSGTVLVLSDGTEKRFGSEGYQHFK